MDFVSGKKIHCDGCHLHNSFNKLIPIGQKDAPFVSYVLLWVTLQALATAIDAPHPWY